MSDNLIDLLPHQHIACDFLKSHPFCGLFLPMGLGKTALTLEALYELNPTTPVLVLGPKSVMQTTWTDEINKWQFPFRFRSLILNEKSRPLSKKARYELYASIPNSQATIYFLNYELTADIVNFYKNRHIPFPFKIVILDEAQAFKSNSTSRFKALRSVRPNLERLIELTGTPAPNGPLDLWALIYLLDEGQRLGAYITHYREKYFYSTMTVNNHPVAWKPKMGAEDAIYDKLKDITISFDTLASQIPPVTYHDVSVELSTSEQKLYKKMMKESVLTFLDDADEEHEAVAINAAVLSAKLSQMASGALYLDEDATDWAVIHQHKLEAALEIINDSPTPVIIAYHFRSDREMLLDYLRSHDVDAQVLDNTPEMVHAWNEGKIPVLLLQPKSSGHGLNLQHGGHTLIWYTLPWSLEEYEQTNARLARQGQTHPVIIHRLLTKNTVDVKIKNALAGKKLSQDALLDAVKYAISA